MNKNRLKKALDDMNPEIIDAAAKNWCEKCLEKEARKVKTINIRKRIVLIAAAAALVIAAVMIPLAVMMNKAPDPAAQPPVTDGQSDSKTVVESTEPAETTAPTDVTTEQTTYDLPRVPEHTELYFAVPPEYQEEYDVRQAYTPDKDGQSALQWLIEDNGETYTKLDYLITRVEAHYTGDGFIYDTTPFNVWSQGHHTDFCLTFEIQPGEMGLKGMEFINWSLSFPNADLPYRFVFEFWYKRADSNEDYRGIRTSQSSTIMPDNWTAAEEPDKEYVCFRVPTYNEGMRDLHTDDGEPVDYDFIIVIRDTEAEEGQDLIGWGEITVTIDRQYEEHLKKAFNLGLLNLPQ